MNLLFAEKYKISKIDYKTFSVPFLKNRFGFYIEHNEKITDIPLFEETSGTFSGKFESLIFSLNTECFEDYAKINIKIENKGNVFDKKIGFHTGIDSYMKNYPQWHEPFFPTLLRCEKTHLWGYFMNTKENALCIATKNPVASYDISYNTLSDEHCGHRILGTDIVFFQNTQLPKRHPENLKVLKENKIYENTIYLIPVEEKSKIKETISKITSIPMIDSDTYTKEPGDILNINISCPDKTNVVLKDPKGHIADITKPLSDLGLYTLTAASDKYESEALFYIRKPWDYYLEKAAENALSKPQKATTHVESFYGFFSLFLNHKYTKDEKMYKKAIEAFNETMPYMFDFEKGTPIVAPTRIQNVSGLISVLCDIYEADKENNIKYLEYAAKFADYLMSTQDASGAYRNKKVHYTCVIYVAKSLLELALAERSCDNPVLQEKAEIHYESVRRAIDELVSHLDNIETEGEMTLEDGMISCSALQIGMFALTLPEAERKPYIEAAEYMLRIHSCLEQQLVPDCRINGASLRFWESQYDVMIRANMLNSPHGWTGWTIYAQYYLYMLTGKKKYLLSLQNTIGSSVQLIDGTGNLHWAFCSQPYIKARTLVPDKSNEICDGYKFVEPQEPGYRGKYEICEFTEGYIDMISGWYRTAEQKVNGGYEFCPLILDKDIWVDNQGGCCDNDVHEIFKALEETVMKKAFIHENEDGSFLTFGCTVTKTADTLNITATDESDILVYNLKNKYNCNLTKDAIEGFSKLSLR